MVSATQSEQASSCKHPWGRFPKSFPCIYSVSVIQCVYIFSHWVGCVCLYVHCECVYILTVSGCVWVYVCSKSCCNYNMWNECDVVSCSLCCAVFSIYLQNFIIDRIHGVPLDWGLPFTRMSLVRLQVDLDVPNGSKHSIGRSEHWGMWPCPIRSGCKMKNKTHRLHFFFLALLMFRQPPTVTCRQEVMSW